MYICIYLDLFIYLLNQWMMKSKIFCQIQQYNNATSATKCLDCLYKINLA